MWIRGLSLVVWALVAASAAFWGLKLFVTARPAPAHTQVAGVGAPARGDLTRLLGSDAVPNAEVPEPVADPRFQLVGVVAPRPESAAREGLAVIVVDDRPARAYRVGAVIDGQTVLQSVSARGANLGPRDGAPQVALNLPPPVPASTGLLPPPSTLPGSPVAAPFPATPGRAPPPKIAAPFQPPAMQVPQRPQPLPQPGAATQLQPLPQPQQSDGDRVGAPLR